MQMTIQRWNGFSILLINTQNKRRGAWLLLLMIDGYGSLMMTIPFYNLATVNKIVLFRLPPHFYTPHSAFRCWGIIIRMQLTRLFGWVMKSLANRNFWPRFSHFATKASNQHPSAMLSSQPDQYLFNPERGPLTKFTNKEAQRAQTGAPNSFSSSPSVTQTYPSRGPASVVKNGPEVAKSRYQTEGRGKG